MLVTLSGMMMDVKPTQSEKAPSPMLVTLPSSDITLVLQPTINVSLSVPIKQFPSL